MTLVWVRSLTARSVVIDVGIAVAVMVAATVPWAWDVATAGPLTVVLAGGSLALRRLMPAGALTLAWATALMQLTLNERPSLVQVSTVIVIATVAAIGNRIELWLAAISALIGGAVASVYLARTGARFVQLLYGPPEQVVSVLLLPTVVLASAWLLGVVIRFARSQRIESERRIVAEDETVRALDEAESERIRAAMARDVHDVVGHSLAVIIAQADSVQFLDDEARIREVSATIAETARNSLVEVRGVLGRTGADDAPDLPHDLTGVIAQVSAAGVTVERESRGTARELAPQAAGVARRVLQEMLTNALRHGAPAGAITVRETWRSSDLVLEVENAVGEGSNPGSGVGLSGMSSRLEAIGGGLEWDTIDDVFCARARIPSGV